MVCPFGNKRMATMSRLLAAKNFSQTIAVEVGRQKLAAQYIKREFCEADEANLLDEEDMHVFDLKPMTDPLYLVSCNSCKKPVKVSQYAAHAEICRSLSSTQEIMSEHDNNGCRKPPKKERKKTQSSLANLANHTSSSLEQVRFGSAVTDNVALSEHVHGNTFGVNNAYVVDDSGNRVYSTGAMPPPSTKRSRLVASNVSPISDHLATAPATATGVYRSAHNPDDLACRELAKGSSGGSEGTKALVPCQDINQERFCYLPSKGVPAPLATKVFYSQRNNRLRLAMDQLYYEPSAKEHFSETVDPTARPGNSMMISHTSSLKNSTNQINDEHDKEQVGKCPLASMQTTPDHNVNNMSKHEAEPNGLMISSRYNIPNNPYSFAGKSEAQLGNAQQSKRGRLPVI